MIMNNDNLPICLKDIDYKKYQFINIENVYSSIYKGCEDLINIVL